jgi:hypothetical protein
VQLKQVNESIINNGDIADTGLRSSSELSIITSRIEMQGVIECLVRWRSSLKLICLASTNQSE